MTNKILSVYYKISGGFLVVQRHYIYYILDYDDVITRECGIEITYRNSDENKINNKKTSYFSS